MTTIGRWLARHLRLARQRWRTSAVRVVDLDGAELHWDRFDDFDAACACARAAVGPGAIGLAWQPASGRRTVVVSRAEHLPQARRLARAAGRSWLPLNVEVAGRPCQASAPAQPRLDVRGAG